MSKTLRPLKLQALNLHNSKTYQVLNKMARNKLKHLRKLKLNVLKLKIRPLKFVVKHMKYMLQHKINQLKPSLLKNLSLQKLNQ